MTMDETPMQWLCQPTREKFTLAEAQNMERCWYNDSWFNCHSFNGSWPLAMKQIDRFLLIWTTKWSTRDLKTRSLTFEPFGQGNLLDRHRQHTNALLDKFFAPWSQFSLTALFVKNIHQTFRLLCSCYWDVHTEL